jgi:hypothetical protein
MSIENEVVDTTTEVSTPEVRDETPAVKIEPRLALEQKSEKSVRNLLKKSMAESLKEEDEPLPLTSKERQAATKKPESVEQKEVPPAKAAPKESEESKTEETVTPTTPQASGIAPPAALTKEEKELWSSLPLKMQEAFLRRESDTQKGVDNLKAKYQPIEDVLAPVRPLLQQRGLTEAHAVKQLFDWHSALASPHKESQIAAFKALAQSHGVNLNLLAPAVSPAQPSVAPATHPQPTDPNQQHQDPFAAIQPYLQQTLQPIQQQLANYEAEIQRQKLDTANRELSTFSKDKPHFEKVRLRMAEILTTASQYGRPVDLQQAYDEAVWGMPEIRSEIMQEQENKRQAEFQASQESLAAKAREEVLAQQKKEAEELAKRKEQEALEKARRANVSPRGTSPVSAVPQGARKTQSVADTLRSVMKENRTSV